ncbi:quinol oxidase [Halobacteriales archaeon QS_1_68_20]|nr:MAG: quinol oxidase [Halobacteriales archaeon QS_1_68_20]
MTFETAGADLAFLAGRVLFAGVVGFLALGNLLDLGESVAYAQHKGVPAPRITVPFGSLALLAGAVSILVGAYPLLGAAAVVGLLVTITPVMHDFWTRRARTARTRRSTS